MLLHEALDASSTARICADGCLVADALAARTGIQQYRGVEVDPDNAHGLRDRAVVNVYRPPEEVFHTDSMASYAAAPVTVDHPAGMVDAQNWRDLGVGEINGDIVRDGERIRVPLIVRDAAAVRKAQTTHKQLSMGYSTRLDFTAGTAPDGTAFDAVQRDIRVNHIALVPVARGGPELRIVDERPLEFQKMKIRIGDAEVDATNGEAVRIAVDALNKKLTDSEAALADAKKAHDKEMAAKDAEIDDLKSKVVDQAKIDALADEKADIVGKAKALLGDKAPDFAGKTVADVRRETVRILKGDAAVADKSDDYIEARFDGLRDSAPADQITPLGAPKVVGDAAQLADAAWHKANNDLNAWRAA